MIQNKVAIQDSVVQNSRQMCIQSRERPLEVTTNEEMEARVMDLGDTEPSENVT